MVKATAPPGKTTGWPRLTTGGLQNGFELAVRLAERLSPIEAYLDSISDHDSLAPYTEHSPEHVAYLSENYPEQFAKQYFWKNLIKCSISFLLIAKAEPPLHRVIDLGCGPGTFTFPFLSLIPDTSVVGIDRNPQQLALAQKLSKLAAFRRPALFRASVPQDIFETTGLFTASYLVAEMHDPTERDAFANFVINAPAAAFLVVDYINVVQRLHERISVRRPCEWVQVKAVIPTNLARLTKDDQISFGVLYASQHEGRS